MSQVVKIILFLKFPIFLRQTTKIEMVTDELQPYSLINLNFYNCFDPIITSIKTPHKTSQSTAVSSQAKCSKHYLAQTASL